MSFPIFVVDAFSSEPFGGNPAAVVFGHGEDAWMQQVAAEMRHSETAFLRYDDAADRYDLRWFSPTVDVDLCGHATLASAHVLYETGRITPDSTARFQTRSGELRADRAGADGITLDFPIAEPIPAEPVPALFDALGVTPTEFLRTDGAFYMCVVDTASTVRSMP